MDSHPSIPKLNGRENYAIWKLVISAAVDAESFVRNYGKVEGMWKTRSSCAELQFPIVSRIHRLYLAAVMVYLAAEVL